MKKNPGTVTGTPSLATGLLTVDQDQALTFDGSTNSWAAADSTSLSITSSMSLECLINLPSIPGTTKTLVGKASSYELRINSSGKLLWVVTNGGSSVTVTSVATITPGVTYHVVCVYNGNYAGAAQVGTTSPGASSTQMTGSLDRTGASTGKKNKWLSSFTAQERGLVTALTIPVARTDEVHPLQLRVVMYSDSAGVPSRLIAQSTDVVSSASLPRSSYTTYTLPLVKAGLFEAGTVWIGYQMGQSDTDYTTAYTVAAAGSTQEYADAFSVGGTASDPVGSSPTGFAGTLSVYADYTAISRTGDEGKALLYINGAVDNSSAYTAGIADNANSLSAMPAIAGTLDELSIWNRVLTPAEIASHYTAR